MGIFGLVLGSFATAVIHREPLGLSWIGARDARQVGHEQAAKILKGGSYCPLCKTPLRSVDLIPFVSWALQRGRCRHCKANIPPVYPLTEGGVAALAVLVYAVIGPGPQVLPLLLALPFLWALLIIDLRHMILPNKLVLALAILGVPWVAALGAVNGSYSALFLDHVGGALVYAALVWGLALVMRLVLKREAMGMGDVKFFGAAGLWLGLSYLPWFMMVAGASGVVLGIVWRFITKSRAFPFGPALILAFFVLSVIKGSLGG